MDLQKQSDLNSGWTNEKHHSFINSMEASFVKRMFENDDRCFRPYIHGRQPPRLDRYLPDSADSTRDFKRQNSRAKTHLPPERADQKLKKDAESNKKKKRKGLSWPHHPSTDQVVPEKASEGEGETER